MMTHLEEGIEFMMILYPQRPGARNAREECWTKCWTDIAGDRAAGTHATRRTSA